MANRKSRIRRLYLAAALFGVIGAYGVGDLITSANPLRHERFSTMVELREVRGELDNSFTLRDLENRPGAPDLSRILLAKEDFLKTRIEEIGSSPEFRDEDRKHLIKSIVYGISTVGFILSSSLGYMIKKL